MKLPPIQEIQERLNSSRFAAISDKTVQNCSMKQAQIFPFSKNPQIPGDLIRGQAHLNCTHMSPALLVYS